MTNARLFFLFLLPPPSLLNILSSSPLASLSSITLPPSPSFGNISPSLPSLSHIRDDLLSLLEQHSVGPQTAPSATRPESESVKIRPKLTRPIIESGGWKPLKRTPSNSPLQKQKTLPINLSPTSTPSLLTQEETSVNPSPIQSHQVPNSLPFSQLQHQISPVAASKKGGEKAELEADQKVSAIITEERESEVTQPDVLFLESEVNQPNVLFREDIVSAGRPLSHA